MLNRHTFGIAAFAALLFLSSLASVHLTALPVFEDEGSQLRLIWRIVEAGEWLQPLADGKPLEAWLMAPLIRLGPQPLVMIRALHVLSGMIGAVLTYRLALQVGDRWMALTSGALFAICPFVVYLQRLALSDIFMCTAGIWVLLRVIGLIRSATWANSAWLAIALLLAALCKFPVGFVFLTSMPLALVLLPAAERRALLHQPALTRVAAAHAPAAALAALIAVVAIIRVRHGQPPGFGLADLLGVGLGQYQGITAAIGLPRPNLITELTAQLSWPVAAIGLIGLAASALLQDWRQRWLIATGALPMLTIGLLASFWFSRYLLFTLPPLIIAAASGWQALASRWGPFGQSVKFAALALCVALMGLQSVRLVVEPAAARWSPLDRFQYFEGWGSGYGYAEAAQFILGAPNVPQLIYSLDGHSAYQLRNYLPAAWGARIGPVEYAPDGTGLRDKAARLENLLSRAPVWIIVAEQLLQGCLDSDFGPAGARQLHLRRIAAFDKPGAHTQLAIYEIK
ncbi:MAG: hypothetical protein JWO04_1107 [Gammaproteobacteria bacterium]|nr:hypothetical protein [Gammaproteobacteria bacterium]